MTALLSLQEQALLPKIQRWIAAHQEALVNDLASWIAIPGISRADLASSGAPFGEACAAILRLVLLQAEQAGFRTEQHDGYAGSVIYGEHARDIGLINHLDVVPAGDNWTFPPFTLSRNGDYLTGRGVGDNKGPGVMNFYLLKLIRDLQIPLHHNLRIVYGLAEETTMADMAWFAQHGPVPAYSIVTDGRFPVNNAQKGQISFTLTVPDAGLLARLAAGSASNSVPDFASIVVDQTDLNVQATLARLPEPQARRVSITLTQSGALKVEARGNGGHAAFPDGTLNAASVLLTALSELELLNDGERQLAKTLTELFASPYGESAGLGLADKQSGKLTLNAGVWRNDEADTLSIDCDIRYPVSWQGEQIREMLQRRLANTGIALADQWRDVPPFYLPEAHPVISLLQQVWNDVTGRDDRPIRYGRRDAL